MLDVLATGYPSLDYIIPTSHSPMVGESAIITEVASDESATDGGCGANVAAGLNKLGFRVGVATIVGDDEAGKLYQSRLSSQGIDTRDVIVVPGANTSRTYLFRNPDGEYQIFFFAGAAYQWQGELQLKNQGMKYGLVTVAPYDFNRQFVEIVCKKNIPVIWQLKQDVSVFPKEAVQFFSSTSQIMMMNHIEAEFVKRALDLKAITDLLDHKTVEVLVMTKGKLGAAVITQEGMVEVSAVPAEVEDTTGAGDAFTAGFIAGLIKKYDFQKCAQIGSVVASYVLEKVGCQTNLPDWSAMQKRYERHFGGLK